MIGRIVIEDLRPRTTTGRYPAKAVVGEAVPVTAAIYKDGHDILAARATLIPVGPHPGDLPGAAGAASAGGAAGVDGAGGADAAGGSGGAGGLDGAGGSGGPAGVEGAGAGAQSVPMTLADEGKDRWVAVLTPSAMGRHHVIVEAWTDRQATWAHKTEAKLNAGQAIDVEMAEAIALFTGRDDAVLAELQQGSVALALATPLPGPEGAADLTAAEPLPLWVDRPLALVGAWYELFPRSYGGFKGAEARIPAIAGMGFDVLYLPPIHPIGVTERKGPDNTLGAGIEDPGSPWAIGGRDGGHTAIDASLGTYDDFSHLVETACEFNMVVSLDYALQCSPDHPWVTEHPEWFHHRPDGSIAYAENPPKKYQDIYPINFWPDADADRVALWDACKAILDFWVEKGVTVFRVDNPHTKPLAFWEWVIPAVQAEHPEAIFLAEAFTKPRMMAKLAEVGFSQSYTYFTWRTEQHGPEGLRVYMAELAGDKADFLRPNFWTNTPDILSGPLRDGPPAAFAQRLVLAATLSPSWGMYSGFELCENEPASPFNEEYLHSEKYEIRTRDFDGPNTLIPLATAVNAIRRRHPALQRLRRTQFHHSDNPLIVAYSKISDDGSDVMLMVVSLDPYHVQSSVLGLDLEALGLSSFRPFTAVDELSRETYLWQGPDPYVRLEPWARVAHIIHLPDADPPRIT